MRKAIYIVLGPAVVLLLSYLVLSTFGPRHTPAGQPRLTDLKIRGFQSLFNSSADKTRVLVMLSPT
jgi:hypothetical protein